MSLGDYGPRGQKIFAAFIIMILPAMIMFQESPVFSIAISWVGSLFITYQIGCVVGYERWEEDKYFVKSEVEK